jgi:hypothetical protein
MSINMQSQQSEPGASGPLLGTISRLKTSDAKFDQLFMGTSDCVSGSPLKIGDIFRICTPGGFLKDIKVGFASSQKFIICMLTIYRYSILEDQQKARGRLSESPFHQATTHTPNPTFVKISYFPTNNLLMNSPAQLHFGPKPSLFPEALSTAISGTTSTLSEVAKSSGESTTFGSLYNLP